MQQKVARYLENEIAPKEYARQQSELLARDSQLPVHGQCREADVDPVNEIDHEEKKDEWDDVRLQFADCCGFDCGWSKGWADRHATPPRQIGTV